MHVAYCVEQMYRTLVWALVGDERTASVRMLTLLYGCYPLERNDLAPCASWQERAVYYHRPLHSPRTLALAQAQESKQKVFPKQCNRWLRGEAPTHKVSLSNAFAGCLATLRHTKWPATHVFTHGRKQAPQKPKDSSTCTCASHIQCSQGLHQQHTSRCPQKHQEPKENTRTGCMRWGK